MAAFAGYRLEKRLHQENIDHRGLVDDQQIAIERVVVAALKSAPLRIGLQKPVDRLCFEPCRLGHPLGCPPGWVHYGGLADAWTAG